MHWRKDMLEVKIGPEILLRHRKRMGILVAQNRSHIFYLYSIEANVRKEFEPAIIKSQEYSMSKLQSIFVLHERWRKTRL